MSSHAAPPQTPKSKRFSSGRGDLTAGPIPRLLLRLSMPMMWGILAIVGNQLVDAYYISLLGTRPLAAISFTFPVTMTIFSLIIGLGIGMSSILSRLIGAGDDENVTRIATHGLFIAAAIALLMALFVYLILNPLFALLGADADTIPMIRDYMVVWLFAGALIAVPIVGNSALRATGDTLSPALGMMLAAGLNMAITPFFVFGLGPFPRLEMQGAAIGTALSYLVALGVSLYVLYFRKKLIFQARFQAHLFWDSAKKILHVGLPAGISGIIQPFTQGVLTALLAGSGAHAVAAFGVVTRIEAFSFVIIMALATGMAPIIGQNHGAGLKDRVRETLRIALIFAVIWSAFVAAMLIIFAKPIAEIFSKDADVIRLCVLYFWIVPVSYLAGNLVQGWASAFNALGQPKKAVMMVIVRMVLLQIPLAILLGAWLGVIGVFISIAAVNIATGLYYHIRNWKALNAIQ